MAVRATALLALTLVVALVAGCSDDSSGDSGDEREIAAVVSRLNADDEPGAVCRTLFSRRLVTAIWGSRAECLRKNSDADDDQDSPARTSGTQVDGDRATTRVRTVFEGRTVSGGLELTREGDAWRIDEFGNDFIRSLLREALQEGYIESAEGGGVRQVRALLDRGDVGRCLDRDIGALAEERQRQIGYAAFGERDEGPEREQVTALLIGCLGKSDSGRQALRLAFEQGIREDDDLPDEAKDCVIRRLRESAPDELIASETARRITDGAEIGPELASLARQAVAGCR